MHFWNRVEDWRWLMVLFDSVVLIPLKHNYHINSLKSFQMLTTAALVKCPSIKLQTNWDTASSKEREKERDHRMNEEVCGANCRVIFMELACKTWTFHQFIWWKSFNPVLQTFCVESHRVTHWWQQNLSHYPMQASEPESERERVRRHCFKTHFKWVDWWI